MAHNDPPSGPGQYSEFVPIRLRKETKEALDEQRGKISVSAYARMILEQATFTEKEPA